MYKEFAWTGVSVLLQNTDQVRSCWSSQHVLGTIESHETSPEQAGMTALTFEWSTAHPLDRNSRRVVLWEYMIPERIPNYPSIIKSTQKWLSTPVRLSRWEVRNQDRHTDILEKNGQTSNPVDETHLTSRGAALSVAVHLGEVGGRKWPTPVGCRYSTTSFSSPKPQTNLICCQTSIVLFESLLLDASSR